MYAGSAAVDEAGGAVVPLSGQILSALSGFGHTPAPLRVGRGELISLQDGRGSGVHVLCRGRMKISRFSDEGRVILLDLVEPGDVFGDMTFLASTSSARTTPASSQRRASFDSAPSYAEALEDVTVYSIPHAIFERMLRARPGLALGVASLLGERCNKLERRLEAQVFQKVPTRLVHQLLELAERHGVAHDEGTLLAIPLSQQDLGNLIGASREIVSLTLSDLKKRGLLVSMGRRLIVREDKLREELNQTAG